MAGVSGGGAGGGVVLGAAAVAGRRGGAGGGAGGGADGMVLGRSGGSVAVALASISGAAGISGSAATITGWGCVGGGTNALGGLRNQQEVEPSDSTRMGCSHATTQGLVAGHGGHRLPKVLSGAKRRGKIRI